MIKYFYLLQILLKVVYSFQKYIRTVVTCHTADVNCQVLQEDLLIGLYNIDYTQNKLYTKIFKFEKRTRN